MEILAILFLIGIAIYSYIDHQNPDKKAESIHPTFDSHTVNANNERKAKQIEQLEDKVRKRNYANPHKEFYREGAKILERAIEDGSNEPRHFDQAGYEGIHKLDIQKRFEKKFAAGITEYPSIFSCLDIEKAFTKDGRSIVLTVDASKLRNRDYIEPDRLREKIRNSVESEFRTESYESMNMCASWSDSIQVIGINEDRDSATFDIVVTLPNEVILTDEYIAYEIKNTGRVFMVNLINEYRHLLPSDGENRIERKNGSLIVHIHRTQTVPFFLDRKQRVMSEKQIARNIQNRLLNRVDVRTLDCDDKTYCGEIVFRD